MSGFSNPYASPQTEVAPVHGIDADAEETGVQPWSVDDVLMAGWELFKNHWPTLSGATLAGYALIFVAQQVVSILGAAITPKPESGGWAIAVGVMFLVTMASMVVQAAVMAGWARLFLLTAQYETPSFGTFFSGFRLFATMFVTNVACTVFTALGLFFFVVPGIIIALSTCLYMFFVAEGDGTIAALKASFMATADQKAALFVLFLVLVVLNLIGVLALGVGTLVTMPVSYLALAVVYIRLTGRHAPRTMLHD